MLRANDDLLRGAGLSAGKIATLRRVGEALISGALDERTLEERASPEALSLLRSIKGIGPWTATVMTVREIAEFIGIGGMGPIVVGSPQTVADQLISWVEATALDGFNLAYAVTPETSSDIVELLIPELQRRGVFKKEYRNGTFRKKLFGKGPLLDATHPAHAYRHRREVPV